MTIATEPADGDTTGGGSPRSAVGNAGEWVLQELIERFSSELDRVQETLMLKSLIRQQSFGPGEISLQLNVFARYDAGAGVMRFRTAEPGEQGASVMKLALVPLLREHIQSNGPVIGDDRGDISVTTIKGISADEIARLERLGIFSIADLERAAPTSNLRLLVAARGGIPFERLALLFGWPFIRSAVLTGELLLVSGAQFARSAEECIVLVDGIPARVVLWSPASITVEVAPGSLPRVVLVKAMVGGESNTVAITTVPVKTPGGLPSDNPVGEFPR